MTSYALIDSNNMVVQVITGVDKNTIQTDSSGNPVGGTAQAWEQFYSSLSWFDGLYCKTIDDSNNNVGIGYKYEKNFNAFVSPQPFPSWKLNYTTYIWEPPIARPDNVDGYWWIWSEINKEWIKIESFTN